MEELVPIDGGDHDLERDLPQGRMPSSAVQLAILQVANPIQGNLTSLGQCGQQLFWGRILEPLLLRRVEGVEIEP
jgi:hypothetical protein